jgi:hypothetical protein
MSWYRAAADAVVLVHVGYILFVVLGLAAIVAGLALKKPWARNFWFRALHLAAILVVVGEAWLGIVCPLTTWEAALRQRAGQVGLQGEGFIEHWTHRLIFYQAPPWVFGLAYTLFGLLVLATFILGPPRWPGRRGRTGS